MPLFLIARQEVIGGLVLPRHFGGCEDVVVMLVLKRDFLRCLLSQLPDWESKAAKTSRSRCHVKLMADSYIYAAASMFSYLDEIKRDS